MGSLSIAATSPGWQSTIRAMRALPSEVKRETSRRAIDLARPLADKIAMEGRRQGSHAASVADTVKASTRGGVPSIRAGGKPYTLGSEFGGGSRRTTYYSTHRTSGRRYLIVQRRSTAQFRPHRGREGYWWFPTIRDDSDLVLQKWREIVDSVLRDY